MKTNDYESLLHRIKTDDVAFTSADLQQVVAQSAIPEPTSAWLQTLRSLLLLALVVVVGSEVTATKMSSNHDFEVADQHSSKHQALARHNDAVVVKGHRQPQPNAEQPDGAVNVVQSAGAQNFGSAVDHVEHSIAAVAPWVMESPVRMEDNDHTAEPYEPLPFVPYSAPTDQPAYVGVLGSYGQAEFRGIWKTIDNDCNCPTVRTLSGPTWATGLVVDLPIDRSSIGAVSFVGALTYQVISGTHTAIGDTLMSINPVDNSITPTITQWRSDIDLSTIGVAAGLRLEVFEGLGFGALLRADALVQSREQLQWQLVLPERARFDRSLAPDKTYSDDGRSIVFTDNSPIRDARPSVYWSFEPFVSWRVAVGPIALTPFASMRLPLTPFQRSSEGTVRLLQGGLTVTVPM